MTSDLHDALHDRIDRVVPPPADLERVRRRGTRIRRTRAGAAAAAAVAVVCVVSVLAGIGGADDDRGSRGLDPLGRLDFRAGLRAYENGKVVHLGGRTFPSDQLQQLDTDAIATPYGMVYYVNGLPMLLTESGRTSALEPDAEPGSFSPTSKMDSVQPLVAYGAVLDGEPTVVVRDLAADEVVATHRVADDVVIDAIDDGVVFLRSKDGTDTWDTAGGEVRRVAGARTAVADVRNGVLLYDGPRPDGPGAAAYRLVAGAIDAQLTFDGAHVLYWSSTLRPTGAGDPIHLEEGANGPVPAYGWWAFDTDGSVLVAVPGRGQSNRMYDCLLPSGRCADLGVMQTPFGDPAFIGVDM